MLQGWVYVMVNASMRDMVKVGRTTREPLVRVAELSSPTGVPTPFRLAFHQGYADCAKAEREIHHALDRQGLRVRANREFFHGPARKIVRIIRDHAGQQHQDRCDLPGEDSARRCAKRQQLEEGCRLADEFCYAELAALLAMDGDACGCLRAWDNFFAAHVAACGGAGGAWADVRTTFFCRRYIACCLMLGQPPGHRALLAQGADQMLEQQADDLQRLRGTEAARPVADAMRWIYKAFDAG